MDAGLGLEFWLQPQAPATQELAAHVDLEEVRRLGEKICDQASEILDQILVTPPNTITDVIGLLRLNNPPIEAVITGLRANCGKRGCGMSAPNKPHPATDTSPDHHAVYQAMAARVFHRFIGFRSTAEHHGAEFPEYGIAPTEREAGERYERFVDEWISEPPATAAAAMALALALVEFAGCIAADKLMAKIANEGSPASDETDALHQVIALSAAAAWITPYANAEGMARLRKEEAERPGGAA